MTLTVSDPVCRNGKSKIPPCSSRTSHGGIFTESNLGEAWIPASRCLLDMALIETAIQFLARKGLINKKQIENDDDGRYAPGKQVHPKRVGERPHHFLVPGKLDERNDGKRKLKRQDDLAENKKILGPLLPGDHRDDHGRDHGD